MKELIHIDFDLLDDPKDYLKHSNFIYNQKGQMSFKDKVYLTEWTTANDKFTSETHFDTLQGESFAFANMDLFDNHNWNVFGFEQSFRDETINLNFTPYHQNEHIELYYLSEGTFSIKLQKEVIHLKAGDVLLINRLINHSDVFDFDPSRLYIFGINDKVLNTSFLKSLDSSVLKDFILKNQQEDLSESEWILTNLGDNKHILDHFMVRIHHELETRDSSYQNVLDATLLRMFNFLSTLTYPTRMSETANSRYLLLFDEIERYMRVHYVDMNLDELAEHLKFSKDHISRLIKETSGLGFSQLLQKIKVDNAKILLEKTDWSIQDISLKIGYQNQTHFYNIFKAQTGITPNDYRKQIS